MIYYIKGILAMKTDTGVIIEAGGIGYDIRVPVNSSVYLQNEGDEVCVFTYMAVKEDDVSLYGFSDQESLRLFKLLITVNGVGAKAGISVLSALSAKELKEAIIFEDAGLIATAQGVGKKIAQRIVLELKDKVSDINVDIAPAKTAKTESTSKTEAMEALIALGYSRNEAMDALTGIEADTSEEYIKKALRNLF